MNSAETLRRAAALMRERAEAATPGPWRDSSVDGNRYGALVSDIRGKGRPPDSGWYYDPEYGGYLIGESLLVKDRAHIASWHPDVAVAVADWLDEMAEVRDRVDHLYDGRVDPDTYTSALAVAHAYLGEQP